MVSQEEFDKKVEHIIADQELDGYLDISQAEEIACVMLKLKIGKMKYSKIKNEY